MSIIDDLALRLKRRCEKPGLGGKVVEIHLFGIEFASELSVVPIATVVSRAGLHDSYRTELRKGMNLAPFVDVKR